MVLRLPNACKNVFDRRVCSACCQQGTHPCQGEENLRIKARHCEVNSDAA